MDSKEIVVTENNPNSLALTNTDEMLAFGEKLLKSGLTPHKKPADIMAAIILGRELGIGVMTAVNHIHSVNGRASVGIQIILAKLLQCGVVYKILKDFDNSYFYKTKDGAEYKEKFVMNNLDKFQIVTAKTDINEYVKEKIQVMRFTEDTVTEIEFYRKVKQIDGTYTDMVINHKYGWSDVKVNGFDDKDNWKKMPKLMLRTRCLTIGARLIAPDYLSGIYEDSENYDVNNIPYKVDGDNAEVIVLENDKQIN